MRARAKKALLLMMMPALLLVMEAITLCRGTLAPASHVMPLLTQQLKQQLLVESHLRTQIGRAQPTQPLFGPLLGGARGGEGGGMRMRRLERLWTLREHVIRIVSTVNTWTSWGSGELPNLSRLVDSDTLCTCS